jgi:hypothetical protein
MAGNVFGAKIFGDKIVKTTLVTGVAPDWVSEIEAGKCVLKG